MRWLVALLLLAFVPLALAKAALPEDSPLLARDETWSATFAAPGELAYHCHPHPAMTGVVATREGAPLTANVTIANETFSPKRVEVAPGGTVTWTNLDEAHHTVTWVDEAMGHEHGTPGPGLGLVVLVVAAAALAVLVRR